MNAASAVIQTITASNRGLAEVSVKLSFENGNKLNQILEAVASIQDEVDFIADEKGLSIREMDPERVAMVNLWISREMLSEFDLAGQNSVRFRLSTSEVKKLRLKPSPVSLTFNLGEKKCVVQQLKPFSRTFNLKLLSSEGVDVPWVKGTFDSTAKFTTEGIRSILEDAQICSDFIRIHASPGKVHFSATGDLLSYDTDIPDGCEILLDLNAQVEARIALSLRNFDGVTRAAASLGNMILFQMKSDFPLVLSFQTEDPNILRLDYALAPRIEVE